MPGDPLFMNDKDSKNVTLQRKCKLFSLLYDLVVIKHSKNEALGMRNILSKYVEQHDVVSICKA